MKDPGSILTIPDAYLNVFFISHLIYKIVFLLRRVFILNLDSLLEKNFGADIDWKVFNCKGVIFMAL